LIFDDVNLKKFALEVFRHSMTRVDSDRTFVRDAGICHGTAGIAHVYNKMWHLTRDKTFKNACDFWINQTLQLDKFDDTISGYKQYFSPTNTYQSSSGLLEGSSGIGLVLISHLTNDFDWDYCIMLN
jgi:lantibiotic modifying enzyme